MVVLSLFLWSCIFLSPTEPVESTTVSESIKSDTIPLLQQPIAVDSKVFYQQYERLRLNIHLKQFHCQALYDQGFAKDSLLAFAAAYLHHAIRDNICSFWYGTPWDYNGYTALPRQGTIACGYLVSTTLQHSGVKVNRYKLAQLYSHAIVTGICGKALTITGFENFKKHLSALPDGLYVVGLDNHVGWISIVGNSMTFIHSSYITPGVACSESIDQSIVLPLSQRFVLGAMDKNSPAVFAWLKGHPLALTTTIRP